MKMRKHNGVWFRGQFGDALDLLLQGKTITIDNFYAGAWEPTNKVKRFKNLLDQANINYVDSGESLRTCSIRRVE